MTAGAGGALALSVSEYRDLAAALLRFWCGGSQGRGEGDAVYCRVTQQRDGWPGTAQARSYSSCGDLAHCMLWELGVRLGDVNREDAASGRRWRVGANVSKLVFGLGRPAGLADSYEAGDILVIWARPDTRDAHVMCVLEHPEPLTLLCAEYGQPGGAVRTHTLARRATPLALRDAGAPPEAVYVTESARAVMRVVRLEDALLRAQREGVLHSVDGPKLLRSWGAA